MSDANAIERRALLNTMRALLDVIEGNKGAAVDRLRLAVDLLVPNGFVLCPAAVSEATLKRFREEWAAAIKSRGSLMLPGGWRYEDARRGNAHAHPSSIGVLTVGVAAFHIMLGIGFLTLVYLRAFGVI